MKRSIALLLFVCAAFITPAALGQTCPGVNAQPATQTAGGFWWYDYSPDSDCVTYTSNMDPTTMWCYNEPSWEVDNTGWGRIEYEFVGDPAADGWTAESRLEFNDPNNSANNWIEIWVGVKYNTPSPVWTMLYSINGSQGDLSCLRRGGDFEAPEGAEISYIVEAYKANSNVTIQIGTPIIMSSNY